VVVALVPALVSQAMVKRIQTERRVQCKSVAMAEVDPRKPRGLITCMVVPSRQQHDHVIGKRTKLAKRDLRANFSHKTNAVKEDVARERSQHSFKMNTVLYLTILR
jgi:hypothetical protein